MIKLNVGHLEQQCFWLFDMSRYIYELHFVFISLTVKNVKTNIKHFFKTNINLLNEDTNAVSKCFGSENNFKELIRMNTENKY